MKYGKNNRIKSSISIFIMICMLVSICFPTTALAAVPDFIPESGSIYVNNVDLLHTDTASYPAGVSYQYDSVNKVNTITLSDAALTVGHGAEGNANYSCIEAIDVGEVKIILVNANTINLADQEGKQSIGVYVRGGNLEVSGTGSLDINTGQMGIHTDGNNAPEPGMGTITFCGDASVVINQRISTEGPVVEPDRPDGRLNVYVKDTAQVTCNGIEAGNNNIPIVDQTASFTNLAEGQGGGNGGDSGTLIVGGVDLLNTEENEYPQGVTYTNNNGLHVVTLSGAAITQVHTNVNQSYGIFAMDAGNVEIVLASSNLIENLGTETVSGEGILIRGGNLTISGTGSLALNTKDTSIHTDGFGYSTPVPGAITFCDSVTVTANRNIRTEGPDGPMDINVQGTANVSCYGVQSSNNSTPIVDETASFTNLAEGQGGQGGGGAQNPAVLIVGGVDLLSTDSASYPVGVTYSENNGVRVVTLSGINITQAHVNVDQSYGILAMEAGDVELILEGNNSITNNGTEGVSGEGILIRGGNLTISGTGSLELNTKDTSIHTDGFGYSTPAPGAVTFRESVTVTANKDIRTEGPDGPMDIKVQDTANVSCYGVQSSNNSTPFVAQGASFINYQGGQGGGQGGNNPPNQAPFNLKVGDVVLVSGGAVQPENIENLVIEYSEDMGMYLLYLIGGEYDGIFAEGTGNIRVVVEKDSTIRKLTQEGYTEYSIYLENGGEVWSWDSMNYHASLPYPPGSVLLQLNGGVLFGNMLVFSDSVQADIGSDIARVTIGFQGNGDESNPSILFQNLGVNVFSTEESIKDVNKNEANNNDGVTLKADVNVVLDSQNIGSSNTNFLVGEGSSLTMSYGGRGDFTCGVYTMNYIDMTGLEETYVNQEPTVRNELIVGEHPAEKYKYSDTASALYLESLSKPLFAFGYNYDNDKDGVVDDPNEEILNGALSIKGATGTCWLSSDGFKDYHFEAGTIVTIELLPDYGYQYEAGTLSANGTPIDTTPQETRAFYTFVMPENNVHLMAAFTPSENKIVNSSNVISQANVEASGNNDLHGNLELGIAVAQPSTEEIQTIAQAAGMKLVGATLDLTISEVIEKAGTNEAWKTNLVELSNTVDVSFELAENLRGKKNYSVVRLHNGVATVLNANYDNGILHFATDKFSEYAITFEEVIPVPPVILPPVPPVLVPPTPPTLPPPPPISPIDISNGSLILNAENGWSDVMGGLEQQLQQMPQSPPPPVPILGGAGSIAKAEPIDFVVNLNGFTQVPGEIFEKAKGEDINLHFNLNDEVTWLINGRDIAKAELEKVDLEVKVDTQNIPPIFIEDIITREKERISNEGGMAFQQISLGHNGDFGFKADLSLDLSKMVEEMKKFHEEKLEAMKKEQADLLEERKKRFVDQYLAYLYYYDESLKTFELQSIGAVGSDGRAEFSFTHASEYLIILKNELDISEEVMKEIKVNGKLSNETAKKTLYIGGSVNQELVKIEYPLPIQDAIDEYLVKIRPTYTSTNKEVAIVSRNGNVIAKKPGKTSIITTIKLADTELSFTTVVTVKKASIKITKERETIKVGEKVSLKVTLYGYKESDLVWSTSRKQMAVVGKNAGKTSAIVTAETKGTDYIIVKAKDYYGNIDIYKSVIKIK